jgi:hypothetical protein
LPLIVRWRDGDLPTRVIRPTGAVQKGARPIGEREPFDFCQAMRQLITDVTRRCPDFRHVQVPRILLSVTQARRGFVHGLQARVTPLRFANGELMRRRRGVMYHIQRYFHNEQEFLYVMTFCLPRFLNLSFDEKFITLFHELYHLHPECNGDFRRHEGRCQFHTRRRREYDKKMVPFARAYLASKPDAGLIDFLRLDFAQLTARHGAVTGIVVPRPKMIPLTNSH